MSNLKETLAKDYGFNPQVLETLNEEQLQEIATTVAINVEQAKTGGSKNSEDELEAARQEGIDSILKKEAKKIDDKTMIFAKEQMVKRRNFENKYRELKGYIKAKFNSLTKEIDNL